MFWLPGAPYKEIQCGVCQAILSDSEEQAIEKIARLRRQVAPGVRLVYFDGDDDLCVQWGELLELVDLYVKKHVFADFNQYQQQFVGKNNLTDYVARVSGRSFAENPIPRSGTVSDRQVGKIFAGYNIGLDEKITNLFSNSPRAAIRENCGCDVSGCMRSRKLAVSTEGEDHCCIGTAYTTGISSVLPDQRVDQKAYYEEMRSSRICVSPFGYGELCWRDFETVLMGSLLVKPDMSHVHTEPNIFIPGETYVPVRWDYSDLAEVCARYLAEDEERNRVTAQAYRVLSEYYSGSAFFKCFSKLLAQADVQPFAEKIAANFTEASN